MWSGDFTYNTKCVIQGFFVLGVWYGSYKHKLPEPKKDGASFLFAAFLFDVCLSNPRQLLSPLTRVPLLNTMSGF